MPEQIDDLRLDGHVKGGDGLVRHQQLRPHGQRPGDGDPLPLSAGQLPGPPVQAPLIQPHAFELKGRLVPQGPPGRPRAVDGHRLRNDVRHRHPRIEAGRRILKDQLPGGLQQLLVRPELPRIADVDSQIPYGPRRRPEDAHNAPRHRGLSGPGFSHQPEDLSPPQLEGDPVQGPENGVSAQPEAVGDSLHVKQDVIHLSHLPAAARFLARARPAATWPRNVTRSPGT